MKRTIFKTLSVVTILVVLSGCGQHRNLYQAAYNGMTGDFIYYVGDNKSLSGREICGFSGCRLANSIVLPLNDRPHPLVLSHNSVNLKQELTEYIGHTISDNFGDSPTQCDSFKLKSEDIHYAYSVSPRVLSDKYQKTAKTDVDITVDVNKNIKLLGERFDIKSANLNELKPIVSYGYYRLLNEVSNMTGTYQAYVMSRKFLQGLKNNPDFRKCKQQLIADPRKDLIYGVGLMISETNFSIDDTKNIESRIRVKLESLGVPNASDVAVSSVATMETDVKRVFAGSQIQIHQVLNYYKLKDIYFIDKEKGKKS